MVEKKLGPPDKQRLCSTSGAQSQPQTRKGKCHLRNFIRHCLEELDVLEREQQARDVMCEECVGNATPVKGDERTATQNCCKRQRPHRGC